MKKFILCLFCFSVFQACSSSNKPQPESSPKVVVSGFQFTEGPYWHSDGFLIFSDIPANIIYKWEPGQNEATEYIEPSGNSNGITSTPDGSLIIAQHSGRVSIISENLELTTIADQYNGKRLNSPNDVVVRSDGLIYFTDPTFGVSDEDKELDISGVYRINLDGTLSLMFDGFSLPNGITFSPDESKLYINDSETGQILRFDVTSEGDLQNQQVFANIGAMSEMGGADGMKTDSDGNLYTTGPNGFIIFDEDGNQLHQTKFDVQITNLAWGGENGDELFATTPSDIYQIQMNKSGW